MVQIRFLKRQRILAELHLSAGRNPRCHTVLGDDGVVDTHTIALIPPKVVVVFSAVPGGPAGLQLHLHLNQNRPVGRMLELEADIIRPGSHLRISHGWIEKSRIPL